MTRQTFEVEGREYHNLIELVAGGCDKAKQVFVTMGEERASLFLVQRLRDYLGLNAIVPELGQTIEIDF